MTAEIHSIAIDRLFAHPDNPRLRLRDDVVTQIAAEITRSGFGPEHALLVRPKGEGYEILSGHHRHEAAKRVGLGEVPAWVREMDDDEAFMTLILARLLDHTNWAQGLPHALVWRETTANRRGKSSGVAR